MRQTVTPYLLYEDADAALEWLAQAVGRTALVYVYVDDVDAHWARAREAGAEIAEEPNDQPYGDRRYAAEDPEGHLWYFATPLE